MQHTNMIKAVDANTGYVLASILSETNISQVSLSILVNTLPLLASTKATALGNNINCLPVKL